MAAVPVLAAAARLGMRQESGGLAGRGAPDSIEAASQRERCPVSGVGCSTQCRNSRRLGRPKSSFPELDHGLATAVLHPFLGDVAVQPCVGA
jgi:hypothetical protein